MFQDMLSMGVVAFEILAKMDKVDISKNDKNCIFQNW